MLHKISNKAVQGPDFTVLVSDVHEVIYEDAEGSYTVEIEGGNMGGRRYADWLIYGETLMCKAGMNPTVLTQQKRRKILKDMSDSLTVLGMAHEII